MIGSKVLTIHLTFNDPNTNEMCLEYFANTIVEQ